MPPPDINLRVPKDESESNVAVEEDWWCKKGFWINFFCKYFEFITIKIIAQASAPK